MKLRDKIHNYLQEKALDKAILDLVGPWGDYYIDDIENNIHFNFKREKIKELETLEFNLPSLDDIKTLAKKIYRKFDGSSINKIVYNVEVLNRSSMYYDGSRDIKDLILVAKDSDIVLSYSYFRKIDIQSKGKVKIHDCSLNSNININAKTVEINSSTKLSTNYINLNAEYVEFNRVYMISDLNINSQLISFNNSEVLLSKNIKLRADMIDCKNSNLKAQNKIEITNTNCDEISGVEAPMIIYNGQDITYSEGIVMPKLRKQLLDHLREIRDNAVRNIDNRVKESTQKQKENLESKPITKILKK